MAQEAWQRDDHAEAARWLGEEIDLLATPLWTVALDHVILAARVARASSDAGLRQRVLTAVEALEKARAEPLFAGVALHARGLLEDDVTTLAGAADQLADSERPLLYAAAVEDLGHAHTGHTHTGRPDARGDGVAQLERAFDLYSNHGATADARRVAKALNAFGVRRRIVRRRAQSGWDSLTASELRVLDLVADGSSNNDVAERLGVSPHTVNTHLRNVFTKLGVHSRAELARLARGDG